MLATDGVFDNVPISALMKELQVLKEQKSVYPYMVQLCCNSIVCLTKQLSREQHSLSPFAKNAILHGYRDMRGGKEDDITVLVSVVTKKHMEKHR